jgi:hypothetical protein
MLKTKKIKNTLMQLPAAPSMACGFVAEKTPYNTQFIAASRVRSLVLSFAFPLRPKHILLWHGFCIRKTRANPSGRKTS